MTDKGLDLFKRSCAYMQPKGNNPRIKIIRHVITYDNHIVLITNNCPELKNLITLIKASLECVGLGLADNKTQLVSFINSTYNKIKFDYAGFTFLYMPKKRIKKEELLTQKVSISKGKEVYALGTHFVYPSALSFKTIKTKIKSIIKQIK